MNLHFISLTGLNQRHWTILRRDLTLTCRISPRLWLPKATDAIRLDVGELFLPLVVVWWSLPRLDDDFVRCWCFGIPCVKGFEEKLHCLQLDVCKSYSARLKVFHSTSS